jgi:formylglycine-generating enzyme required for sulfatase activity
MGDVSDTLPKLHPKTGISWFDAIRYCMKRTDLEGLAQCYDTTGWQPAQYPYTPPTVNWDATGYRLPTEDEWEYAARANANLKFPTSDGALDSTRANYLGKTDSAAANFNVHRTYDSVWLRLTPGAVYFDHITRSGATVSDTESYTSKNLENGAFVYSYSLIQYLDTVVLLDTNYIDTFVARDSVYLEPDPIFPNDPTQAVVHNFSDTLLVSYKMQDTVIIYDTLMNRWERFTPLGGQLVEKHLFNEINDIDSVALNKIFDTDSIFVFVDTTQDTTLLTGSYQWFGFKSAASYAPSPYRLYDMAGNASEWCWEADNPTRPVFRVDEHGPDQGTARMRRGGDYTSEDYFLQSGGRNPAINPSVVTGKIGFRTVRRAP